MSRVQEIADYITQQIGQTKSVAITLKKSNDSNVIEIEPQHQRAGMCYAPISIIVNEKGDYLGFHVGKGNTFDTSDSYNATDKEYIWDIVKACLDGNLKETIYERNGKILKSKLEILLPSGWTTFTYHSGPLSFGGKKSYIKYEPYPVDQN